MKKKIDAVKLMREIRDKLSEEYRQSPRKEKQDLTAVRKKHHLRQQKASSKIGK
jgi:hypothetical protein